MDQTREALPQRVIEPLDMISLPGVLRNSLVLFRRNHTSIGVVLIRVEHGLLTVHQQDLRSQLFGTLTTAIPDVKGDDLEGPGIHSWCIIIATVRFTAPVRLLGYVDCLSRVPGDRSAQFCGEGVIALSSPYPAN